MERTVMFYGYYTDRKLVTDHMGIRRYNMPLAYLLAIIGYVFISLILMVRQ